MKSKRVSNYELFFDLAFVLAMRQLNSQFHLIEHPDIWSIISFVVTNAVLLLIWITEVYYFNKYGDARRIDINTIIILMFLIGHFAMSFNFDFDALESHQILLYNGLFALIHLIIVFQYYLKGRILGFSSDLKRSIRDGLITAGLVVPTLLGIVPITFVTMIVIYGLPIVILLLDPPRESDRQINFPHIVERAQLVTILTFGETIIAIIHNFPLTSHFWIGFLLFIVMSLMFRYYTTQTFLNVEHHQRRLGTVYGYAHIILIIGINFFTVSIEYFGGGHASNLTGFFFILGNVLFYLGTLMTNLYNKDLYRLNRKDVLIAMAFILVYLLVTLLVNPNILLLGLVSLAFSYIMLYSIMHIRYRSREKANVPHPDAKQNLIDEIKSFYHDD